MKKKVKIILSSIILLAIIILVWKRWNAWFGNPDEQKYELKSEPHRVLMTIGTKGENSRFISWFSSSNKNGSLQLIEDSNSDTLNIEAKKIICNTRAGITQIFNVELDNLSENSSYHYRVKNGNECSNWFSFKTRNSNSDFFSFIYLGDIQDQDSASALNTKRIFAEIMDKNKDCEFVLLGGDFIERPMDKYWDLAIGALDTFAAKIPFIATPGNHEYLKGVIRKIDNRYEHVFPYYRNHLNNNNKVFSFKYANSRFVLLDTDRDWWNLPSQYSWFKDEVNKINETWKISMFHHPIYSIKGANNNLTTKLAFRSTLENNKFDIVLQGHEHGYARKYLFTENEPTTPLYVVSYFSSKAYPLSFKGDYQRYGSYYRYYQRFNVKKDTLEMISYNEKHEIYDHILLLKNGQKTEIKDLSDPNNILVDMPEWYRKEKGDKKADKAEKIINEWKKNNHIK